MSCGGETGPSQGQCERPIPSDRGLTPTPPPSPSPAATELHGRGVRRAPSICPMEVPFRQLDRSTRRRRARTGAGAAGAATTAAAAFVAPPFALSARAATFAGEALAEPPVFASFALRASFSLFSLSSCAKRNAEHVIALAESFLSLPLGSLAAKMRACSFSDSFACAASA